MTKYTLSDMNRFRLVDEKTGEIFLGYDQEWYGTPWQRLSGCGPTTACNILRYLTPTRPMTAARVLPEGRSQAVDFMEDVWQQVTPTRHGISSTKHLYTSVLAYARTRSWPLAYRVCDVSAARARRPAFAVLADFLYQALSQDLPVAFLNLCNGNEANLDEWHWVMIIAVEPGTKAHGLFVKVLDNGVVKRIDLAKWFETTTRGGGLIVFSNRDKSG